jgi:hypothetical protein
MDVGGRAGALFASAVRALLVARRRLRPGHLRTPAFAPSASVGRGLRRRHSARRVAETWWASHAPDAMIWTLGVGLCLAVGVGIALL